MQESTQPLFGLPQGAAFRSNLILSGVFGGYFWIVYWTGDFVAANSERAHVALSIDLTIPLVPWTAVIYLTITPLLCLAPFIFRTPERLLPLFATMMAEVTVAGVVFCLFPVELSFPEQQMTATEGFLLLLARLAALQYNCVPSLHVTLALTAAWSYLTMGTRLWRGFLCCWVAAIVASTLLAHQHHLLDLVAGVMLTVVAIATVPPLVWRWQRNRMRPRTHATIR